MLPRKKGPGRRLSIASCLVHERVLMVLMVSSNNPNITGDCIFKKKLNNRFGPSFLHCLPWKKIFVGKTP